MAKETTFYKKMTSKSSAAQTTTSAALNSAQTENSMASRSVFVLDLIQYTFVSFYYQSLPPFNISIISS